MATHVDKHNQKAQNYSKQQTEIFLTNKIIIYLIIHPDAQAVEMDLKNNIFKS
jgi:hypothetical protein